MARTDEYGVPTMSEGVRAGLVRVDDGAVFVVEVCSDAVCSRVELSGELDFASAPLLQQVLDQLCRDGYPEVVLDLSGLTFLSAAGLTVFLRADDQLRDTGGRLILERPGRLVRRVLAITELDTVLTIRETARDLDHATTNEHADHLEARTTLNDTVTTRNATGQPTSGDAAGSTPVLAAVWCRSVGTTWTLELHRLRRGTPHMMLVDWISSGVPISQPEPPETLARELLAQHGLHLFRDSLTSPCTGSRRGIGYVAGNAELITLAHLVRDDAIEIGLHPVMLAAQWIATGFSADAAARWIRRGVTSPQPAPHQRSSSTPAASPPTQSATMPSPDPAGRP